jgi:hypothetical protein
MAIIVNQTNALLGFRFLSSQEINRKSMDKITFDTTGRSLVWWGYADYYFDTPNGGPRVLLSYAGEPPHGDSYHKLTIGAKTIRGFVWSSEIQWSQCRNYFTCDWLEGMGGYVGANGFVLTQVLRATIVVSPSLAQYRIVLKPSYAELKKLLQDSGDRAFWDVLLRENSAQWESFS